LTRSHLVSVLREWRRRQKEERLKLGEDWPDTGLVFTSEEGTAIEPRNVNRLFDRPLSDAKLPHMRIHDLRHGYATWLLREEVDLKRISELLGHSTIAITADIYAHVDREQKQNATDRLDRLSEAIAK